MMTDSKYVEKWRFYENIENLYSLSLSLSLKILNQSFFAKIERTEFINARIFEQGVTVILGGNTRIRVVQGINFFFFSSDNHDIHHENIDRLDCERKIA